jgi:hypothetical protein
LPSSKPMTIGSGFFISSFHYKTIKWQAAG